MSTTGGTEQGTVYVLDEPDVDPRASSSARRPTRGARSCAPPDKPGITNLIEILAVARGVRPGRDRARVRRAAATATSRRAVGDEVAEWLAPVRERYHELRGDEARLEEMLAEGAERARAIAAPVVADVRDAMGVGRARRSVGPAA